MNKKESINVTDDPAGVINNLMRNRNTVEFLVFWETLYNSIFKPIEFERFRGEAGRYGGTYADKDNGITNDAKTGVSKQANRDISSIYCIV